MYHPCVGHTTFSVWYKWQLIFLNLFYESSKLSPLTKIIAHWWFKLLLDEHNASLWCHYVVMIYLRRVIFWQFSYPYGYLIYEVTTYYYGRTIQLQILLMVFKCYIWGLPWKYYGISISFQSQKWIRFVIKQLLPNNSWYWWLYQSSKVKNCDISKWQKCDLDRSSLEVFTCILISLLFFSNRSHFHILLLLVFSCIIYEIKRITLYIKTVYQLDNTIFRLWMAYHRESGSGNLNVTENMSFLVFRL